MQRLHRFVPALSIHHTQPPLDQSASDLVLEPVFPTERTRFVLVLEVLNIHVQHANENKDITESHCGEQPKKEVAVVPLFTIPIYIKPTDCSPL